MTEQPGNTRTQIASVFPSKAAFILYTYLQGGIVWKKYGLHVAPGIYKNYPEDIKVYK